MDHPPLQSHYVSAAEACTRTSSCLSENLLLKAPHHLDCRGPSNEALLQWWRSRKNSFLEKQISQSPLFPPVADIETKDSHSSFPDFPLS